MDRRDPSLSKNVTKSEEGGMKPMLSPLQQGHQSSNIIIDGIVGRRSSIVEYYRLRHRRSSIVEYYRLRHRRSSIVDRRILSSTASLIVKYHDEITM